MDAFDRFSQWANKPLDSHLTTPAELHRAVMELLRRIGGSCHGKQGHSSFGESRTLTISSREQLRCCRNLSEMLAGLFGHYATLRASRGMMSGSDTTDKPGRSDDVCC